MQVCNVHYRDATIITYELGLVKNAKGPNNILCCLARSKELFSVNAMLVEGNSQYDFAFALPFMFIFLVIFHQQH